MRICIIGSSGHVGYIFPALRENTQDVITGMAPGSPNEDMTSLMGAAEETGNSPVLYTCYQKMLDTLKPDVAVVSPHFGDHAAVAIQALACDCHVFVEKPLATTFEDLELLRTAHSRAGTHLAPMFGLRYQAAFYTAWRAVQEGRIGTVRLLTAQKSYRLGTRSELFKQRSTYGGTIPWVGSHSIDLLAWFSGQPFKSVMAAHSTKHNRNHGDLEMTALCQFTFADEVFGSTNIDYLRPASAPAHGDDRIRVAGTTGVIEVRNDSARLIEAEVDGEQELPLIDPPQIFSDFLAAARGEHKPQVTAEDGFRVTDASLRARLSADKQRIVTFDEDVTE